MDVVVDSVPPPGIFGVGLELNYTPGIIRVTGVSTQQVLHFSAPNAVEFEAFDPLADTDGSFRVDSVDLSGNDETGAGRVLTVTLECISAGTSPLTLTDNVLGADDKAAILHQNDILQRPQ